MHALEQRVQRRMTLASAQQLQAQGRSAEATALLEAGLARGEGSPDDLMLLADWAAARGEHGKARSYYQRVLVAQPGRPDARLGVMESAVAEGNLQQARHMLGVKVPQFAADDGTPSGAWRRCGPRWVNTIRRPGCLTGLPRSRRDPIRCCGATQPAWWRRMILNEHWTFTRQHG